MQLKFLLRGLAADWHLFITISAKFKPVRLEPTPESLIRVQVVFLRPRNKAVCDAYFCVDKPECKKCSKVLMELENIDDEADQLGIGFVKINDENLAEEYNLEPLPALVYYRHQIPIIYEGSNLLGIVVVVKINLEL